MITAFSCNQDNKSSLEEEHEEPRPKGVVILNERQRNALNLKLGNFQMRNLTTVIKTNGQLEVPPASSANITAIIGGNLKEIKVFHGDKVKKGQLLAVLEHPDYITLQEDFAVIVNNLEFLEIEYARQKELFENNVGAGRDYQQAKADYNNTKARYKGLNLRLQLLNISPEKVKMGIISNTINILSPINGYVSDVKIKVGTYVDAKDILFEITDNSAIHADFIIYEKDVQFVKEGQKIHFTVSNRPGEELTAIIFAIGKEFETNTRAVHIHANITDKISGLIPGMYITGHFHTDDKYTLTLPSDAVVAEGTKSFVFILDETALEEHSEIEEEDGQEENSDGPLNDIDGNVKRFKMVEVITGQKDDVYTEIHLIDSLPDDTQIVMNAAYYLLADMKKEETEH